MSTTGRDDLHATNKPPHHVSKITHPASHLGAEPPATPRPAAPQKEDDLLPVAKAFGASKITAFGKDKSHEEQWSRTPNTTGAGAIHVKTFNCKLTDDALAYMDQTINEWLDAHPQYEVKFVTSTVGTLTSKVKEPHLICQVWV